MGTQVVGVRRWKFSYMGTFRVICFENAELNEMQFLVFIFFPEENNLQSKMWPL